MGLAKRQIFFCVKVNVIFFTLQLENGEWVIENDGLLKCGGQLLTELLKDGGPSWVNIGPEFPWVSYSFSTFCFVQHTRCITKFGSYLLFWRPNTDDVAWSTHKLIFHPARIAEALIMAWTLKASQIWLKGDRFQVLDLSVCSLQVLAVSAWVLYRFYGFFPQPKSIHVRLIGDS